MKMSFEDLFPFLGKNNRYKKYTRNGKWIDTNTEVRKTELDFIDKFGEAVLPKLEDEIKFIKIVRGY